MSLNDEQKRYIWLFLYKRRPRLYTTANIYDALSPRSGGPGSGSVTQKEVGRYLSQNSNGRGENLFSVRKDGRGRRIWGLTQKGRVVANAQSATSIGGTHTSRTAKKY